MSVPLPTSVASAVQTLPGPWKQTGFHETARDRHLPNQKQQRDRVPAPDQRPGLRDGLSGHRTTSSSVPIIWPLSRRDRIASNMRSLTNPNTAKQTMPANIKSNRTHSSP